MHHHMHAPLQSTWLLLLLKPQKACVLCESRDMALGATKPAGLIKKRRASSGARAGSQISSDWMGTVAL